MITVSDLEIQFGKRTLFQDVNLKFTPGNCYGVIGANGAGKSTFLRILSGDLEPTRGTVMFGPGERLSVLKQDHFAYDECTVLDTVLQGHMKLWEVMQEKNAIYLKEDFSDEDGIRAAELEEQFAGMDGWNAESDAANLLSGLGISEDLHYSLMKDLSGKQKVRVLLAQALFGKPDNLLLDEPTNHLDVTTIEWLEGYLKSYPKAVVVVSHDRMFLDNVVDVVYEIEYGTARRYPGNYTNFIARKKENYDKQMKDHIAQQKEIERLQRMVTRFKGKPTKTSMAQSKQKAIDRMVIIEAPDKYDNKTFHANFQPEKETGNDVLYTSELAIGYDHPLSVVSLDLKRGEKLGILGGNGLGKSTFLKTIVGKIPALSGEYRFGTNVQIGYFDQQMAMYTSNKTVLDDFWDEYPNLTETEARNALGAFLFSGDDVFKNVNMLSGGEKVRLALCKILKTRPNVLVLDEPTNHMDIVGKETLESMLKDYKGTLIFVSHDRYFVKKVATQLLVFEDGTTNLYQFGYEQYQEKLDREAEESKNVYRGNAIFGGAISQNGSSQTGSDANRSTSQTAAAGNVGESTNANSAAQAGGMAVSSTGKAYYNPGKERSKIQKKVKKAEEDLAVKEAKLDELMKPEYQSSYSKLTEIQNEIDALEEEILIDMEAWEELSSQLEALG